MGSVYKNRNNFEIRLKMVPHSGFTWLSLIHAFEFLKSFILTSQFMVILAIAFPSFVCFSYAYDTVVDLE